MGADQCKLLSLCAVVCCAASLDHGRQTIPDPVGAGRAQSYLHTATLQTRGESGYEPAAQEREEK